MTTRRRRETQGVRIDRLDRQLIAQLHRDGRQSTRELARYLRVPEATVRYSLNRLITSGVLTITAVIDPHALGTTVTAVIRLRVAPLQVGAAAEHLATLPEVSWLAITTGATTSCCGPHLRIRRRWRTS